MLLCQTLWWESRGGQGNFHELTDWAWVGTGLMEWVRLVVHEILPLFVFCYFVPSSFLLFIGVIC